MVPGAACRGVYETGEEEEVNFSLPWPPTLNTYWRHPTTGKLAGRHLISAEGRAYRHLVAGLTLGEENVLTGPVSIEICAVAPDRRRRDLDNIAKAVLDALVYCGTLADDSQVWDLRLRWRLKEGQIEVRAPGRIDLTVREV